MHESPVSVELDGASKVYGKRGEALRDLSLRIAPGQVYGLLGPNGAGKTTALRLILGLLRPTRGRVRVFDSGPGSEAVVARTSAVMDTPAFYPYLTAYDNLVVMARYAGVSRDRIMPALERVGLEARARTRFAGYSFGMRQRLSIALALLKDADLYVFDEPTTGLDPAGVAGVRELLRELAGRDKTVILSSHLLGEVQQVCDRVAILNQGALLTDASVADLRGAAGLLVRAEPFDLAVRVAVELLGRDNVQVRAGEPLMRLAIEPDRAGDLNRRLLDAGVSVSELRAVEYSLEDVFLRLTGGPGS